MAIYQVKAFGVTKEILGGKEIELRTEGTTVKALREVLVTKYPSLSGLRSLMIAVNNNYGADELILSETDEIALIPPVSGG